MRIGVRNKMAKIYMTCGKICSGKTTYAEKLRIKHNAVVLSVDEITLALFGNDAGEKLDFYVEKLEEYFFVKALDIVETGKDVIFDWGFWTKQEREYARKFFDSKNVEYKFFYLNVDDDEWHRRIEKRNQQIEDNETEVYYVDEGLAEKVSSIFEEPDENEIPEMVKVEG